MDNRDGDESMLRGSGLSLNGKYTGKALYTGGGELSSFTDYTGKKPALQPAIPRDYSGQIYAGRQQMSGILHS